MPSRRHLLAGLAGLSLTSGCLSGASSSPKPPENPQSTKPPSSDEPGTSVSDGTVSIESVSVADFFEYPLAGTHPHVYNAPNRQFVLVRVATGRDPDAVRDALSVTLDGDPLRLANRQPVPWSGETVDVAFRVSKDRTVGAGSVAFQGNAIEALPETAIERLNAPPRFSVVEPTLETPAEIEAGGTLNATVSVDVANEGPGDGTFGASLSGNYTSGSRTVTAPVDAGTTQSVSETVRIRGNGDAATVRLDWGLDTATFSVPVVGETTTG